MAQITRIECWIDDPEDIRRFLKAYGTATVYKSAEHYKELYPHAGKPVHCYITIDFNSKENIKARKK